jgi:DNA-binding transcriptional ArsR family regulator
MAGSIFSGPGWVQSRADITGPGSCRPASRRDFFLAAFRLTDILVSTKRWPVQAVLAALAAPRRRLILGLLRKGEHSAGQLHRALPDVTFGAVSQHLRVLADAGLVVCRTAGRHHFYSMALTHLTSLRPLLDELWEGPQGEQRLRAQVLEARRGPRARRSRRRPR